MPLTDLVFWKSRQEEEVADLAHLSRLLQELRCIADERYSAARVSNQDRRGDLYHDVGAAAAYMWIAECNLTIAYCQIDYATLTNRLKGNLPLVTSAHALAAARPVAGLLLEARAHLSDSKRPHGSLPILAYSRRPTIGHFAPSYVNGLIAAAASLCRTAALKVELLSSFDCVDLSIVPHLRNALLNVEDRVICIRNDVFAASQPGHVNHSMIDHGESRIRTCLSQLIVIGQVAALPGLAAALELAPQLLRLHSAKDAPFRPMTFPSGFHPMSISPADKWILTWPTVWHWLREQDGLDWATRNIDDFWTRKNWVLDGPEREYLAWVEKPLDQGILRIDRYTGMPPFVPVYVPDRHVRIKWINVPGPGSHVWPNQPFCFNHWRNRVTLSSRILRLDKSTMLPAVLEAESPP